MLADAPSENTVKGVRKLIESDVYKTVEEQNTSKQERKRRRKKHKNKQRPERPNKGKKKKGLGKFFIKKIVRSYKISLTL